MTSQVTPINHRYAADDILEEILRSPPLNFAPEEIKIKGTNGEGYQLFLPRKLHDKETIEVLQILGSDAKRLKIRERIESRGDV